MASACELAPRLASLALSDNPQGVHAFDLRTAELRGLLAARAAGAGPSSSTGGSDGMAVPAAPAGSPAPFPGPSASEQLAGLEAVLDALREAIGWPLRFREEGAALGARWRRGLLLHGPPGTGKSAAVAAGEAAA